MQRSIVGRKSSETTFWCRSGEGCERATAQRREPMKKLVLFAAALIACGGNDAPSTPVDASLDGVTTIGKEGGPCYGNGTCDKGLTCASNLCVNLSPDSSVPDSKLKSDGLQADAGADSEVSDSQSLDMEITHTISQV
jgi:hypothetical protein